MMICEYVILRELERVLLGTRGWYLSCISSILLICLHSVHVSFAGRQYTLHLFFDRNLKNSSDGTLGRSGKEKAERTQRRTFCAEMLLLGGRTGELVHANTVAAPQEAQLFLELVLVVFAVALTMLWSTSLFVHRTCQKWELRFQWALGTQGLRG